MVIIYYEPGTENVYISSEDEITRKVSSADPDLLDYVPNDDIVYVKTAHIVTKKQFGEWLSGSMELEDVIENNETTNISNPTVKEISATDGRKFIHPTANAGICIEDIKTERFPDGVVMMHKWDFVPIDEIGGEECLETSVFLRTALARGKVEIVDSAFVKANAHKIRERARQSPRDAQLDRIIIKDDQQGSARRIASQGGLDYGEDDIVTIFVDGK